MPRKKTVPSLLQASISSVAPLVRDEALRVAHVAVTQFVFDEIEAEAASEEAYEEMKSKAAWEREIYLSDQVQLFKDFVLGFVPPSLLSQVLDSVLNGVKKAIRAKKQEWTPTTNLTRFTRQMYAIVKFSNVCVLPTRTVLDLETMPKIIRTKMFGSLKYFTGLKELRLGSGSGGWVTEAYSEHFLIGIPHMKNLVVFSLKYDCTGSILQVLSETCSKTLKVLDIERSRQVKDDAAQYILACKHLQDINVFQTDLSVKSLAKILVGLKELQHLQRGDFLCEVVEYFEDNPNTPFDLKLNVQDFWASEDYYFHSEEQMQLVAKYCPNIRKMLYMYQITCGNLSVLADFNHLEDLDLWGGAFYEDGLCDLLELIGHRMKRLSLVHVEEVDERAIALVTVFCPNLVKLGFHNCEFKEERRLGQDEAFAAADRARMAEERRAVRDMATPLLDLVKISIVSCCSADYVAFILEQCLNAREVFIGMTTGLTDECLLRVLATNGLQHLESLTVQRCKGVTMKSVELLLGQCDKLRVLRDLSYFDSVHEMEIKMLRARLKEENFDVDTGEGGNGAENEGDDMEDFMRKALKDKYPPLDNSIDWESGW